MEAKRIGPNESFSFPMQFPVTGSIKVHMVGFKVTCSHVVDGLCSPCKIEYDKDMDEIMKEIAAESAAKEAAKEKANGL